MADTKLTALTATTAIDGTEIFYVVEDPSGTPLSRKVTGADVKTYMSAGVGGTPGGSDTQVQFNDSSAFNGDAGLTYNKTTNVLTNTGGQIVLTGGTVTDSTPPLSITQTWNDAAELMKSLVVTITSTASAATSRLIDLILGSSSLFIVERTGNVGFNFPAATTGYRSWMLEGGTGVGSEISFRRWTNDFGAAAAAVWRVNLEFSSALTFKSEVPILGAVQIVSSGATFGIGYTTGAGGTIAQASSRTTGVTINKITGAITLVSAAGSTTPFTFAVTNSAVAATDAIIVNQKSGTDLYDIDVTAVAAGSFNLTLNTKSGTTVEQPVFNFAVIKGVTS